MRVTTQLPVKSRDIISKMIYIQIHSAQRHSRVVSKSQNNMWRHGYFLGVQLGSEKLDWKKCSSLLSVPVGKAAPRSRPGT